MKTRCCNGAVVECRTRDPEVPGSNPGVGKKKISHRSNQNNTTTNSSAPEINTWNCQRWKPEVHCGAVLECRTRDPEVPSSNPGVGKKKISHRCNQNNTTTNSSAPELNTWNYQRWKPEVTVAQCYSAGLEIQRSLVQTLSVGEKNMSHRSNQNNITTNSSAPELNTWKYQRWKPEITVAQCYSAGLDIQRSPVQTPVWVKRTCLTGPIRTIPPPILLHQR